MSEPLADTWHERDLPVLREVVRMYDDTLRVVRASEVEEATGLDAQDVQRAGVALAAAGLITIGSRGSRSAHLLGGVTGEARRLTGAWPTSELVADRLIAALEAIADNTDNDDERTRARKILDALSGSGRQIAVSVGSAIVTGQVT